ncbi:flagellar hook-length control protein FliK [Paraburkholderia sp. J41]|uniref:flagellar hook-length control protein FliK n=1 Tax=Paraburkholderia sp. J41 TaxID=2805433 RepID=UPI002AC33739|nr:flagellar hook-length control protein FliK [Paraburkholderia sp. J41]
MNGIDTGAASLLASRVAALTPVGPQEASGAAQAGVSALAPGLTPLADAQQNGAAAPQDSAQTVLSAVALALDAIIRSGGEATPAVVGRAPVWADPAAAQGDAATLPLPGMSAAQAAEAMNAAETALLAAVGDAPAAAAQAEGAEASQNSQATSAAQAQTGAVAALAASLAHTVSASGLFYEAHLVQWLRGQYTLAQLADEPQNRFAAGDAQLPLDWSQPADDIDDVQWIETFSNAPAEAQNAQNAARADAGAAARNLPAPADARADANAAPASREPAGRAAAALDTLLPSARDAAQTGNPSVHPGTVPLVRQQLDMLATGEFRWNGEAWPGVRLDWTLQQDRYEPREGRDGRDGRHAPGGADDPTPWRTRLTLALPKLGTVDAELTLAGTTLAVRVQASEGGAARLTEHSEALRGRLEALGLTLAGLSIREVGGAGDPLNAADAAKAASAASAYAAQTEQRDPSEPREIDAAADDWEMR